MSLTDTLREHRLVVGAAALGGGWYLSQHSLPGWSTLVGIGVAAAVIGGIFASGRIADLLPDEHGIYIATVNARRERIIGLWELTEDQFEDMTVANDGLRHCSEAKHRAYLATAYDPESNTARGDWLETPSDADLLGYESVDDVLDEIIEIREELEPEARYHRAVRRRLPSILRRLDAERAADQVRAISPNLSPKMMGDDRTIDDVMQEELPDEVLPPRIKNDAAGDADPRSDEPDSITDAVAEIDLPESNSERGEPVDVPVADGGDRSE